MNKTTTTKAKVKCQTQIGKHTLSFTRSHRNGMTGVRYEMTLVKVMRTNKGIGVYLRSIYFLSGWRFTFSLAMHLSFWWCVHRWHNSYTIFIRYQNEWINEPKRKMTHRFLLSLWHWCAKTGKNHNLKYKTIWNGVKTIWKWADNTENLIISKTK